MVLVLVRHEVLELLPGQLSVVVAVVALEHGVDL